VLSDGRSPEALAPAVSVPNHARADAPAPYLFYRRSVADAERYVPEQIAGGRVTFWRPSWRHAPPPPIRSRVNWAWWLFHNLHVFRSRGFCVILVSRAGRLVHRSSVFPAYFRFPFMRRDDVQIGDTWTDASERGRGIATAVIGVALALPQRRDVDAWYIVEQSNAASIRAVEKAGFTLVGRGNRLPRLGLRAHGYYAITESCIPS
jgi:RimJ/RimL family protein N-acetyltransferase